MLLQVLEFERKKVADLKRRVQDQVRQQWEERRQQEREINCHSLNSVGSEESRSSLTGSDAPTERFPIKPIQFLIPLTS